MKKNKKKLLLLLFVLLLGVPFYLIPEYAVLISAGSALIVSMTFVFYQVSLVFFDKSDNGLAIITPTGLPGEKKQREFVTESKKKKTYTKQNLPGSDFIIETSDEPSIEIIEEAPKPFKPLVEFNQIDMTRNMLETITFWDDLSFYKIKDSEIYNSESVKHIGELFDFVFSGLGAYLQRYKLTLDDILNENTVVKEYEQTYSSVVFGFIISLIEKEIAVNLHKQINRADIALPKTKPENQILGKVIHSPEFKYQILLIIRKFYESKKQD